MPFTKRVLPLVPLCAALLAAAILATTTFTAAAPPAPDPQPPTKITPALATIPIDFQGILGQRNLDLYSWMTFIAMNWPADAKTCAADTKKLIGAGGPTVWQTYLEDTDVFVAAGQKPSAWCPKTLLMGARAPQVTPAALALSKQTGVTRFVRQIAKAAPEVLLHADARDGGVVQAVGGPLTDQNGRFVRYEIHLNQDEYNYILGSTLWSQAGQKAFTGTVDMPRGPSKYGPVGAIEIKAAWKILGKGDDASRFYTTKAIVFCDDKGTKPSVETLGLAGLHIIHKTPSQGKWLWSTFEQVDNTTRSFHDSKCPAAQCPPNKQTVQPPYNDCPGSKNKPVQVTRTEPIDANAMALNQSFQKLLAGTPWANYELISTQWVGNLGPVPKPEVLRNTVLETYLVPGAKPIDHSSCIECHSRAMLFDRSKPADMSFLLKEAK